ncbi:MAG: dCMP deaminase family protein [Calditrichaeota bacterium]|nr:dCMP deaminase family protein [Calditrichota bacterium]RQV92498.1 MAG: dCMP deaminase family protein [bacterium]RQV99354.1 MAG: dCMP deaminase family protein [Calditrichota bacterium]
MNLLYLSWDEYFMGIAIFTSLRSKDPSSKVGAVIVNHKNHIIGTGYNGFIAGIDESAFGWEREGEWLETKYPYVVHAEANAILNSTTNRMDDCRIYSTLYPCNECAKKIAQKEIKEVIYLSDKHREQDFHAASVKIFQLCGIITRRLEMPSLSEIVEKFSLFLNQ